MDLPSFYLDIRNDVHQVPQYCFGFMIHRLLGSGFKHKLDMFDFQLQGNYFLHVKVKGTLVLYDIFTFLRICGILRAVSTLFGCNSPFIKVQFIYWLCFPSVSWRLHPCRVFRCIGHNSPAEEAAPCSHPQRERRPFFLQWNSRHGVWCHWVFGSVCG